MTEDNTTSILFPNCCTNFLSIAQSESELSDNQQAESICNIETELTAFEKQSSLRALDVDVGDTVCAVANPMVEALIIGKTITQSGRLEFLLLLPSYKRKGEEITPAAVLRRDHEKISRRRVRKFAFPMPKVDKWRTLALKNKTDYTWTEAALITLNKGNQPNLDMSPKETPITQFEENQVLSDGVTDVDPPHQTDKQIIQQLRKKVSELQGKRVVHMDFPMCPDSELSSPDEMACYQQKRLQRRTKSCSKKKNKKSKSNKKSKRHHLTSTDETMEKELTTDTSFTSSTSDDDSSSDDEFICLFSQNDTRGSVHLKARMKGRKTERKYVRWALHNLYSSFNSLKCVVNDIRSQSLATGTMALTFDLIWLEQHAIYLDTLLFDSFRGVWRQWNEPVLDQLALAFLKLLVRVSPRKEYSDHLDERVRKWMKRKRIGLSQKYGPVPAYMQQAKVTEAGILVPLNNQYRKWSNSSNNNQVPNTYKTQQKSFVQPPARQNVAQPSKPTLST